MQQFRRLGFLLAFAGLAGLGLWQLPAIGQSIGLVFQAQNGLPNAPSIYGAADAGSGFYFGTGFTGVTRHFAGGSLAANNLPVLSNAGATPLVTAGSTDQAGQFSSTAATTTGTLTFGTAWTKAPACIVQEQGGTVAPTYTVTTVAIVVTVLVAAANYNYVCFGLSGG